MGFNFRAAAKGPQLGFEHEEEYNGGSKRPDTHTLHGVHPETGDRVGWLTYDVPRRKADKIYVQRMEVEPEHKGNGYAGQLMDEMQRRHPNTPIDHGDRTPEGQAWWNSYTQDKSVRRGRTIAHHTAAVNTRCQTPGAQFHTTISGPQVGIMVDLPMTPDLNESQAELLESNMHNAMELVLRPYFDGNQRFTAAIEEDDDAGSVDRHDSDVVESAGAQEPEEVAGDETPASCSYCGSDSFTNLTDNGRVRQATCAVCGGTMSAHPGAQWTPELIGDPSNHPSPNPDPRSGGVGGAGAAATDPLVRDQSRIGAYEGPTSGEIHRGMVVDLAPHERAKFDSAGPEARARILTGKQPHAGMHWTDDEDTATSWAHHPDAAEPEPDHTRFHVVMHAEHPGVEHAFQGDRSPRNRQSIFPYGQEWETPLHPGAPVNLHGVSWLDSRSPGYEPEHAADWTMHPEEAWEHHSLQQPIKRYAKLTDPEMHEALTRFGHNHQTGQQHPHREHTLTPVKHAGFKGYVEGYEGHHEDMKQADRDLGDDHESGGDDDFDDELHEATAPDPNTHEQAHHEEHGEYPDSYYERHDEAYAKAKQDKEDAVRPVAHHGAAHNMLANEMERNYPAWHTKGEIKKVDLSKHDVYAMQPHVVDRHINRYLKNPGDTVAHVQEHGMSLAQDMYPGTHRPMFIKHENNLFTVEGHHRTASALLRKEPVEAHVYDADKHGFPHYDEDEDYGDGFDKHEGLQKHSMLMGADCDFDIEDPREAHQHALRHHDDGVCTLTEAARHKSGSTPKTAGRYERTSPTGWHYDTSISGRTKVTNPSGETTEHYNDLMGSGIKQHRHHEDMPVPLYHGMNRPLEGDQIEPGRPGNFVKRMKHVYMTEDPNEARNYAGAKGTVYEVQPTGWYGHRSDAKGLNWASEHPLNIVREVPHEESPGYEAGTGKLKEAAADGPDWCTWRQAAQCTFPNDRNNTLLAIPQVRGACPWTTRYQQQLCPISEPGPMALMQTKGSIPAGPCDTCKGKGTVSWNDEDPDWKGEPEDNPGKTFTEPCDDCDGKGHVPEISDEEIAQQKRDVEERQLVQRQQVSKHVRSEHPDRSKPPTWDEVKSCPRSCPVANEYSRNRHGSLEVTALSWDEIGDRHPHVYGDSEIHGDAADGADGPGIGDAANYLAHERPGHLDAEDSSVHDMHFREETVHPRHIDYSPSGVNDPRVRSAREGYQQHPNEMPPLVLVKRHNVYQVADGHHRAEAAHGLDMPVNAYVADSPHNDEPFADDERAPFHRAEPIAKTAMPSRKHPVPEGIQADDDDLDPNEYENEQTHPGWDHRTLYARFPHDNAPAGFINYSRTPEGHSNPAVAIHMIKTYDDHKGKGVAAYLMDHLREQHPNHMFDHGAKSPSGKGFWNSYDDPGDPKLNLDHPDNEHLKDTYRPTEEARWRADKDLSYMGTLSIPQAYELAKVARQDSEMAFHVTAAWSDVRNKAKRIRAEGKVMIKAATSEGLAGVVEGDSGAYDNMITYRPGTRKIADWSCDCKWGEWAWDRIRFHGRQCSHSLALQYEAQSRGMFGREVHLGALKFGAVEELDELAGATDTPVQLIARNLTEADEDPADVMKILMAYGLPHSAALQMLSTADIEWPKHEYLEDDEDDDLPDYNRDSNGKCTYFPDHPHEHEVNPRGYNGPNKYCPHSQGHTDWDSTYHRLNPEIHRGMTLDLHQNPGVHDIVHDESKPIAERAKALTDFVHGDHLGTHWTDQKRTSFHYTNQMHHGVGKPPTQVVFHALLPEREHIETDPHELTKGDVIGYDKHPDAEVPLKAGAPVDIHGVSWHSNGEWKHHSIYPHTQEHIASLQVEADQEKMCQQCGHMFEEDATRCPVCNKEVEDDFKDVFHDAALHTAESEEQKRRKKHHRTNDTRRHAPNFGYGVPGWISLPLGWCPQCDGNGCGHCGGTGQVAEDGNGHTANPVPDQNGDEGPMMSGGISDTSSLRAQGTVWYHGTPESNVDDIREDGVQKSSSPWDLRLTDSKEQAAVYARMRGRGQPGKVLEYHVPDDHPAIGEKFEHNMFDQNAHAVSLNHPLSSEFLHTVHEASKKDGPTCSGVALKAADTGRVLMLQRGLGEDHPAAGKWEFPGGHNEEGDTTSLHAGVREWEEEVGQPFPEGGTVHHTWTSPDGVYQGHVVVIPSEKDLSMKDGRVIPNPDDPKGDEHEQAAWWDIDHAKGNKVLRDEVRAHTPWKDIAKAGTEKTASSWDALSGEDDTPGFPYAAPLHSNSQNPGSAGWATSEDPKSWTSESEIPDHLLPESSYYGMLHDSDDVLPQALEYDVDHGGVRQTHGISHLSAGFSPSDSGADFSYEIRGQDGVWVAAPHIGRNYSTTPSLSVSDVLPVGSQDPMGSVLAGTEVASVPDMQGTRFAHEMGVAPAMGVDHARFATGTVGAVPELPVASGAESGGPRVAGIGTGGGVDLRQVAGFGGDFSSEHVQHSNRNEATLHDQPEGALPSTDGADEDGYQPPETQSSIPDTDSSLMPNQFTGSVNDIVMSFQATAGAKGIMADTPTKQSGGEMSFDYTAAARQYLAQDKGLQKSALKDFSFPEQQDLINEGKREDVRARNFGSLQIEGTHYEALSRALGLDNEDPEELFT